MTSKEIEKKINYLIQAEDQGLVNWDENSKVINIQYLKDIKAYIGQLEKHNLLKEFVQFIKDSWAEEIKLWENQLEDCSAFSCERKVIEHILISMRKMLGLLDSDLERFLEENNNE